LNSDFNVTVGSEEYPDPGSLTTTSCKRLFFTVATATAPVPPPPLITTAGGEV
jgi:hypothetical protein